MPNRKRNRPFSVRLSEEEYRLWERKYRLSKLSKTDYFVRMLKGSVIKIFYFSQALNILYRELRKIGVNLNQIAYCANSGYSFQAQQKLLEMSEIYGAVLTRLKRFLEQPLINACIVDTDEIPKSFNPLDGEVK
jgi:hypothetical protein